MLEKATNSWRGVADKALPNQAENAGAQSQMRRVQRANPSVRPACPAAKAPGDSRTELSNTGTVIALRMPSAKRDGVSDSSSHGTAFALERMDDGLNRVLTLVSRYCGVPTALMFHPSRCRAPIARARQLAMYLMNTSLSRTMTDIGAYFGRDRTTVAHACGRVEDWRDDPGFDDEVAALEAAIDASVETAAEAVRSHG